MGFRRKYLNAGPNGLYRLFRIVVAVSLLLLAGSVSVYAVVFSGGLSSDQQTWGAFGDFLGGVLGPMFGFLSLIAILTTVWLQSIQLELSRSELVETRKELVKQAKAQEASERALTKQAKIADLTARLTAINHLLEATESELERLPKPGTVGSDRARQRTEFLLSRRLELLARLDELYARIVNNSEL